MFLEPLPVTDVKASTEDRHGIVNVSWVPNPESHQDSFKLNYHEVESGNGDSNSITTNTTSISLEDTLLPGRNYSLSVQALSKKMESNETFLYVVTRPSAPIIGDLKPMVDNSMNISWKSDVNSKQDKYELKIVRNDTGEVVERTSYDTELLLTNLYPGAAYLVKVYAISHGLRSDSHDYFQPVCK